MPLLYHYQAPLQRRGHYDLSGRVNIKVHFTADAEFALHIDAGLDGIAEVREKWMVVFAIQVPAAAVRRREAENMTGAVKNELAVTALADDSVRGLVRDTANGQCVAPGPFRLPRAAADELEAGVARGEDSIKNPLRFFWNFQSGIFGTDFRADMISHPGYVGVRFVFAF